MGRERVESANDIKTRAELDTLEKFANALSSSSDEIQLLSMGDVVHRLHDMGINASVQAKAIEDKIKIIRGKIQSMEVYEVTESELAVLEKGSPSSLFLNFSVFLVSVATSFLISLLTTTIPSSQIFTIFVVVTVVGYIGGIVLLGLWLISYKSVGKLSKEIRDRLKPE